MPEHAIGPILEERRTAAFVDQHFSNWNITFLTLQRLKWFRVKETAHALYLLPCCSFNTSGSTFLFRCLRIHQDADWCTLLSKIDSVILDMDYSMRPPMPNWRRYSCCTTFHESHDCTYTVEMLRSLQWYGFCRWSTSQQSTWNALHNQIRFVHRPLRMVTFPMSACRWNGPTQR